MSGYPHSPQPATQVSDGGNSKTSMRERQIESQQAHKQQMEKIVDG